MNTVTVTITGPAKSGKTLVAWRIHQLLQGAGVDTQLDADNAAWVTTHGAGCHLINNVQVQITEEHPSFAKAKTSVEKFPPMTPLIARVTLRDYAKSGHLMPPALASLCWEALGGAGDLEEMDFDSNGNFITCDADTNRFVFYDERDGYRIKFLPTYIHKKA